MNEQTYFFVLGTNHSLSKVDIVNTLVKEGAEPKILAASEELLIVETARDLELKRIMNELGSAAKMGRVLTVKQNLEEILAGVEVPKLSPITFGISVYGAGGKFQRLNEIFYGVPKLAREIKTKLAEQGIEANYLPVKERELPSAVVDQRGLLTKGFELVLGVGEEGIYVGKTLAVQDYKGYSARDYGRPARDPKAGLIPPKLAKMMINLALKGKEEILLDPFCGSGTVLQEAVLLGYQKLIGSDSSEKSIRDSQTNLDWLFAKFGLKKKNFNIQLFCQDVQKIASKVSFKTVSAIVTEPYLGSPAAKGFNPAQIQKEVAKLEKLYLGAFEEFRKVLKDDGVIVMIFPIFRFRDQYFQLDIMDGIYALGFKKRDFIPVKPAGSEKLNLNLTVRGSIIFFRPGQTVSREIFVFEKAR